MCKFYVEDTELKEEMEYLESAGFIDEAQQQGQFGDEIKLPFKCCETCIYFANGKGFPGETILYCDNSNTGVGIIDLTAETP